MTTKTNRVAPNPIGEARWQSPPQTTEERLQHIEALGQRVSGHVQFMCQVGNLGGASGEAKDRAVSAFHERLLALERQLARIQEDLRLE